MFCPQCGTESTGQFYCRLCGANLKVIGKAVTLSEAIARSDRGPMPKLKEMVKNLKLEHVSEEVSRAFDQINTELAHSSDENRRRRAKVSRRRKTPEERRERLLVKGIASIFSGAGLTLFLYFLTHAVNLRLPADVIAAVPFEIDPVVRVLWLVGLVPMFAGVGRVLAAQAINLKAEDAGTEQVKQADEAPTLKADTNRNLYEQPVSVTERTTNILDHVQNRR